MTRSVSRPLTLLLAFALAVAGSLTWSAQSEAAVPYPDAQRIEGTSHVQAAVNISRQLYPNGGVEAVVLARDNLFPDSLAATGFAGVADAPILFTATASLSPATRDEIQRVMTSGRVYILGGPNAVSKAVEDQIRSLGYAVSRFEGADRFQTASLIANALLVNDPDITQVVIARGVDARDVTQGWVDAVSCGAWAAERGYPILLVDPDGQPGQLPAQTRSFLSSRDIVTAHVCGGPAAVTPAHAEELKTLVTNVFRVQGENRALTAIAAAEVLWKVSEPKGRTFLLVPGYGDRFGYGIAASQLAARLDAPILLVDSATPTICLGGGNAYETLCWLQDHTGPAKGLVAIGSTGIISDDVLAGNAEAAGLMRDVNPPGRVEDLIGEDKPGDAGTAVRLTFAPVTDPEGAEVSYDVYFRQPPEPEPEPTEEPTEEPTSSEEPTEEPTSSEEPTGSETATEEPTEDPSATETATEEPTEDPLTKENGTLATRTTVTETEVDEEPIVIIDIEMCDRAIPTDEEGEPTSETPESTCKDTEYEFIVIARDSGGNEAEPSDTVAVAPVDDVPAAPAQAPTAENAEAGFTRIRWTAAPEADAAGYIVERTGWFDAIDPFLFPAECDSASWEVVGRVDGRTTTTLLDNGTATGETYCYRYRIFDTTNNESENSPELEEFER